ncbi:MAG: hypothetical protein EOP02_34985 [Proteobacteria bacterium]|nr:MAG: hypothetical protein EOP02_34985 [Pseudomonadota bacterium]
MSRLGSSHPSPAGLRPAQWEVRKPVWLAFFNGREQYDQEISPGWGQLPVQGQDHDLSHSNWLLRE